MLRIRVWSALVGLLLSCSLVGQHTLTGTVTADSGGEPLIGASVYLAGAERSGVITDEDGQFTLRADALPATLLVSYTGYVPLRVELGEDAGAAPLTITLTEGLDLGEVVVTALGLKRDNRELGYTVQQIDGATLTEVQATNFVDNLAGQLAGVRVTAGATGVGSSSQIVIRGETSFTNNNPLFVVDGVPINNRTVINPVNEAAAGFQEVDFGNGAMEVNPADVASVNVLKGPSAAALYGTRAANGVVLITTRDGAERAGLGVSLNSSVTVDRPFQLPRYQNSFGQGQGGEFAFVDGLGAGVSDNITYSYGPRLDVGVLVPQFDSPVTLADGTVVRGGDTRLLNGTPIPATPFVSRPDNVKDFYRTGTTAINNLAIAGGGARGDFRLSLTDLRSESYIPGVDLKRQTATTRATFRPTDRLTVRSGLTYVNSSSDNRPAGGYGSENINYDLTAWLGRQTDLDVLRDYWQPGLEGVQQFSYNYTFFDNPYLTLLENRNSFSRDRLFGFLSADYQLLDNLRITLRSGMDYSDEQRQFRRAYSTNRFPRGAYAENDVTFREINTELLLDYRTDLGEDLSLNLVGGGNRMQQRATNRHAQALTLAQPGVFRLSNAASPVELFDVAADKRINSVYALARLGYRDHLFLDLTARNDWSSALATPTSADNVSFFYPSVSLSWLPSRVLTLPGAVSFWQLRSSWAQVGNDTDPLRTSAVFRAQTPFGGQPTFSEQDLLANPELEPEVATSLELGTDLRFFDDRLRLDLTWYEQVTENQILSLPVPISSGYRQQIVNGGRVSARGVEAVVGLTPIRSGKLRWDVTANFSRSRARVDELPAGTDRFTLSYSRVYNSVNQTVFFIVEEGGRIGDFWGTGYLRNEDGDYVVSASGNFIADNTLRKLGNANPDFMLGLRNDVTLGNWTLGLLLDWRQGGELVSRTLSLAGVAGQLEETENRPEGGILIPGVVNTGTDDEPVYAPNTTPISAEQYYRSFYNRNHEEHNVYDASYLKVRELRIGYRLGAEQLRGSFLSGLEGASISLIGRNLFAFTAIPHFDPEQFAIQGQNIVFGVEDMTYPSARSFGLNLGLTF